MTLRFDGVPPRTLPVTAIVSTKNEERAIGQCVRSLQSFARVVVVDSMSSDATASIALEAGAEVVNFEWDGKYPKKKQWCLDNLGVKHEWVIFVDADEVPTDELLDEIRAITSDVSAANAYDIPLEYHFMGQRLRHGHKVVKRALLKPAQTRFPVFGDLGATGMAELEGHYQPVVQGEVGRTRGELRHRDPDPVGTWFDRHNKYADWEAYLRCSPALLDSIRAARSGQGQVFDKLPFKPLVFFIYAYVVRLGFLDRRAGFDYAVGLSWYYWLTDVKVRERLLSNESSRFAGEVPDAAPWS